MLLVTPSVTLAETVLRTGSDISVEEGQVVEGDYYVSVGPFGKTVMSGSVAEDMYALGASVTVNGEIGHDVAILAGTTQLYAPVLDDVRIIAGDVTIAKDIGGDVFVIAGVLHVLSTATIAGDIFFFGGELNVEGDVLGSILGKAEMVSVNSQVGGGIDITAPAGITLGNEANIAGSVQYTSYIPINRGQGTVVVGDVLKTESAVMTTKEYARGILIPIFIVLFATLSLYLLFKKGLESIVRTVEDSFAKNLLVGSSVILLGPLVSVLLMVTVLGLFVGIMTFSVVVLLYIVGIATSGLVLGSFTMRLITKRLEVTLATILVGTFVVQLLMFVPFIGPLMLLVIFAVTVGALSKRLYQVIS